MGGFMFMISIIALHILIYIFVAKKFQTQEDVNMGLNVLYACASRDMTGARGRKWIKQQCSKFRRRIARMNYEGMPNSTNFGVASFLVFSLLLLAGDIEINPGPTPSSNSCSESSVIDVPELIARGTLHQGDVYFSEESRGRQCAFMALLSLVYNHHEMAVERWKPETIDEILDIGDSQFLHSLQKGLIPDAPNLSVEHVICAELH